MRSFIRSFFDNHREIKIITIYALAFWAILLFIKIYFKENLFEASNFLYWDAEHYDYIRRLKYEDYRVAFFPLLPLIWKWLTLNVYGIVLFNSLIFFSSFWLLSQEMRMTWKEIIICLTIPSFIFFYLPFSESLFFLSSVFLIIGIKNNRTGLILTGLFIASLSRPAFLIFIPALFIIEFLTGQKKQNQTLSNKIVRFILYLIIMGTGTLVVAFIQFRDTHEWFRFLEVQKGWGNYLQIPNLPLTSWAGGYIVRLDGSAFLSGMITGFFLLLYLIRSRFSKNVTLSKEVIFSLAYLGGITLSVLLFRGGSLFSLNRFVFSTAFIVVALHYFYSSDLKLSLRQLLLIFVALTFFWILFFKSYSHIQYFLKFTFLTLYLILPFTLKSEIKLYRQIGFVLLLALNIFFQISFYLRFLDGGWIG